MLAQEDGIVVTGTPIPQQLLTQSYGRMPKGIGAYDLSICNQTAQKQSVVSSRIYQALSRANTKLQPIGRQIMLSVISKNQNQSPLNLASVVINATAGLVAIIGSSRVGIPAPLVSGVSLGSLAFAEVTNRVKPVLSADKIQLFDSQVLEPAVVLDSGSCVERTVFTLLTEPVAKRSGIEFHVR